eukprot:6072590-Alexandrium_andersonii.AAC.1
MSASLVGSEMCIRDSRERLIRVVGAFGRGLPLLDFGPSPGFGILAQPSGHLGGRVLSLIHI